MKIGDSYKVSCENCNALVINGMGTHEDPCSGTLTFTNSGRKYTMLRVCSLDMWGDEVNDRHSLGYIMVPLDCSDRTIVKALKDKELINGKLHYKSFTIDGDVSTFHIMYKQKPMFQCEVL